MEYVYTKHDIEELKKCANPYTGQAYFLEKYFKINHPTRGSIDLELNRYQEHALKRWISERFCIDLASRQIGKTTLITGYMLWCALFNNNFNILGVSGNYPMSEEKINRMLYAISHLPEFLKCTITSHTKRSICFENGSMIIAKAMSETPLHSISCNLVVFDEVGFIESSKLDNALMNLIPNISYSNGGVLITSSKPTDDNHRFNEIWSDSRNNNGSFDAEVYPYTFNKVKEQDALWEMKTVLALGRKRFDSEYLCK